MASAAIALVALYCNCSPAAAAAVETATGWPVTVSSMAELLAAAAPSDAFGTGERTSKIAFVSLQARGTDGCSATPADMGLETYTAYPDLAALTVADVEGAAGSGDLLQYFDLSKEEAQGSACRALGFLARRTPLDKPVLEIWDPRSGENVNAWVSDKMAAAIEICNEREVDRDMGDAEEDAEDDDKLEIDIWFNTPGSTAKMTGFRRMKKGSCSWMSTYLGTTLIAKDHATGEVVGEHVVRYSGLFVVHPFGELSPGTCSELGPRIKPATDAETMASRRAAEEGRKQSIRTDPGSLPHFTKIGFKKMRVPTDVWDTIMTYYDDNKQSPKLEMWGRNNVYTNNEEAPSYMVNVPESWIKGSIKNKVWEGIRPTLEEWAGDIELEPTALYGIRIYTNGSWLANHIDTRSTHVISTIINVDQEVDEDWPLEIFDHAGEAHHILMKPGDMVLYESATCVHGRPTSFKGRYFANVFTHFKPVDEELWPAD